MTTKKQKLLKVLMNAQPNAIKAWIRAEKAIAKVNKIREM